MPSTFDYAIVRVVPFVERGEQVNVGIVMFCREKRFLDARVELDEMRLRALAPSIDLEEIGAHLSVIPRVARGDGDAGPIARFDQAERFHWLVAPRSAVIQISAVHSGICVDPAATFKRLFNQLVRVSDPINDGPGRPTAGES